MLNIVVQSCVIQGDDGPPRVIQPGVVKLVGNSIVFDEFVIAIEDMTDIALVLTAFLKGRADDAASQASSILG